jgi:hypothetical protein
MTTVTGEIMGNYLTRLKFTMAAILASQLLAAPALAADWLTLQGTEPAGSAARAKIWGFVQPQYTHMDGTKIEAGPWAGQNAVFNTIPPDLDSESGFHLRRARIGARGTGFPLDSNVNYFLLAEFGNNGVTASGGGSVKLTDASITLNHLKDYTRLRFGQFKTPGSEDGLQAIHVHNYNNFSLPADQLLLERFRDSDGLRACNVADLTPLIEDPGNPGSVISNPNYDPTYASICQRGNGLNGPVGAYRDIGVQLFNTFKIKDGIGSFPWEVSYAFMVGNGNGIARGDNDDNREFYYYLSAGQVFGGKGARREDWKVYAWYQDGKRTIYESNAMQESEFDRERWGVGGTYRRGKYRLYGEYIEADGMINDGTDGGAVGGAINNANDRYAQFRTQTVNEADGWYLDFGYKVLPNLELDVRYDELDRVTEGAASTPRGREFERWTIGAQYFFNKKSRFTLNYEFRDVHAHAVGGVPEDIVHGTDDQLTAQVLVIF